jgi:hypothetical protein
MTENESKSAIQSSQSFRLAGRITHSFINSKLTPFVIAAALLLGAFSILKAPREEEPQIVVPMLDVFVRMPGAPSEEVAQRVSLPMEKLLREVPGVEYINSISHPGVSMLVVRFYVGTKEARNDGTHGSKGLGRMKIRRVGFCCPGVGVGSVCSKAFKAASN